MRNFKGIFLIVAVLAAIVSRPAESKRISATDDRIEYIGRVSLSSPGKAVFTYPGVQLLADFSGTSVSVVTKPGSGYFMVEIDDLEPFKVKSEENDSVILLADDLEEGQHYLTLTYANEGLKMKPEIHGLILDDGADLTGVPTLPKRKLEFIGNSITCGLGNEGDPKSKQFDYSMQNQFYTYEAIVARELNAQCMVVARSGIGIYRNNSGNPRGDRGNMRDVYPFVQFGTQGEKWDFSRYTPDAVCVNLGTNDTSNPSYDVELLTAAYRDFIKTLRGHYPDAKIVLLTGCMINGKRLADVKGAINRAVSDVKKQGVTDIYTFDFTPDDGSLGKGVYNHPSRRRHEYMAGELLPFLKEITGWR